MPTKRSRLNRDEQRRYWALARRLQSEGVDCGTPNAWQGKSHILDIFVAPAGANLLCQLPTGTTGCAIWVSIISRVGSLILKDFVIASEWDPEWIVVSGNEKKLYGVGAAFEFTEEETLNGRLRKGIRFSRRGAVAEGWLVARSETPIPKKYEDRKITRLKATITDQIGYEYTAFADSVLYRSAGLKNSKSEVRHAQRPFEIGNHMVELWSSGQVAK